MCSCSRWGHMSLWMYAQECADTPGGERLAWRPFLRSQLPWLFSFVWNRVFFSWAWGLQIPLKWLICQLQGSDLSPSSTYHQAQNFVCGVWESNSGPLLTEEPQFSSSLTAQENLGSKPALSLPSSLHPISPSCPLFRPFLLASMMRTHILCLWLNISFQYAPNMAAST